MTPELIHTDTAEAIGEQAVRAMRQTSEINAALVQHYSGIARAILTRCRHELSGYEEEQCEIATGDFDDPDGFNTAVLERLAVEYARVIGEEAAR